MLQAIQSKILGIEISDHQMKMVELKKTGKRQFMLFNLITVDVPEGSIENGVIQAEDKLLQKLKTVKKQYKLKAQKVHLAINSTNILLRPLQLEPLPTKFLDSVIELEIANNMQLPFTDFTYDYVRIDTKMDHETNLGIEQKPMLDLMLVIASKSMLEQYVSLFRKLRMEVNCVDLAPLALLRILTKERGEEENKHFFLSLNIHQQFIEVSIFHQSILQLSRNIMIDQRNFVIADEFMESPNHFKLDFYSSDVIQELERIVNFYRYTLNHRDIELQEIVVTGQLPDNVEYMLEQIQGYFNVPTIVLNSKHLKLHSNFENLHEDQLARYMIPIGLAIKDVKV